MKLLKFRVKNYKSIIDSGDCWLASDITTLAGKNESGKSAMLEALRDVGSTIKEIPENAHPLDVNNSSLPTIEFSFRLEFLEDEQVFGSFHKIIDESLDNRLQSKGVVIRKSSDGSYELFDDELWAIIENAVSKYNQDAIDKVNKLIGENLANSVVLQFNDISFKDDVAVKAKIKDFLKQMDAVDITLQTGDDKASVAWKASKIEINTVLDQLLSGDVKKIVLENMVKGMPSFIFFSDFENILPFELQIAQLKSNQAVLDFAKIANLDLDKFIATKDSQRRRNLLSEHCASISGNFLQYWQQNKIELKAEPEGEKLRFGVVEAGETMMFKVEQRSKGFQWFLSFYLRLNAQKGKQNIIIIDEPALSLHAKAQENVLKVLEEQIAKESQVIISTHSPYLMDINRLDRIRLVIKDEREGTKVENKIHKNADSETLTPINTAIGVDVFHKLSITGRFNIIVEGISDYYYFQSVKEFDTLKQWANVSIIPSTGADRIPNLVSLMIGWGREFKVVLDNDSKGKRVKKELMEKLHVDESKIVLVVSNRDDSAVEDLFDFDDFNKYVLEDLKSPDSKVSNSKFLKQEKLDKVLLAKKFFEKIKTDKTSVGLSTATIKEFSKLASLLTDVETKKLESDVKEILSTETA